MPTCRACGSPTRFGARFCWNCATPLASSGTLAVPSPAPRPTPEDTYWLAATLHNDESSNEASHSDTDRTQPLSELSDARQENAMDPSHGDTQKPAYFGGRYEIVSSDDQGQVAAIDHQPWRQCWACGSLANDAGESFCIDCGAALEARTYQGMLVPADAPTGLALIPNIIDEAAREVLPTIWDVVEEDDQMLVLMQNQRNDPVEPPLDEVTSLRVGLTLAQTLQTLHSQSIALGQITPEHLHITAAGQPRLHHVPNLQRIDTPNEAAQADLHHLAELLEALTDTPRTTQRLSEDEALATSKKPMLTTVLREVRTDAITNLVDFATELETLLIERTRPLALRQMVGTDSNTGMVRDHNEDSLFSLSLGLNNTSIDHTWGLYIVTDGMGGHAAGEVASSLAIRGAVEVILREYLAPTLDLDADYDADRTQEIVFKAVRQANEYVVREGHSRGNDMGTTLTMALVVGDRALIANVGDSRTYLYREGKLHRVTQDHSLVMRLVELGQITEEDIYTHPQRNAVLRSLGDNGDLEVDLFTERLQPGDVLLLCSDGQWEMTHDPEMEQILAQYDDPQQACRKLIEAANQAGGEDNVTSVLVKFAHIS